MGTDLKRDVVKYVRDKAKKGYNRDDHCYICGGTDGLDFHHYHSVTQMLDKWLKANSISISSADDIIAVRDRFIAEHTAELYEKAVTLCHRHHEMLHRIYGQKPSLATAGKQESWVGKQRDKQLAK